MFKKKWRDLRRAPKPEDIAAATKDVWIDDGAAGDGDSPTRKAGRLRVASEGCIDGFPSIPSKRARGTADIGDNRRDRYGGRNFPTGDILALMGGSAEIRYGSEDGPPMRSMSLPSIQSAMQRQGTARYLPHGGE